MTGRDDDLRLPCANCAYRSSAGYTQCARCGEQLPRYDEQFASDGYAAVIERLDAIVALLGSIIEGKLMEEAQ